MVNLLDLDSTHEERLRKELGKDRDKAQFLFFRIMGPRLQQKLCKLVDLTDFPKVFLHGNPHIDNYAKTMNGEGMLDFDRSRIGPYAWDIVRFMASLGLRRETDDDLSSIDKKVSEAFLEGYLKNYKNKDLHYSKVNFLHSYHPTELELTTNKYLEASIKWAKKMRKSPLPVDDKKIQKLVNCYFKARDEEKLLKKYRIIEAGKSAGSLGKNHFLVVLETKEDVETHDDLFLDIKETYTDADDEWFYNPTDHHGLRMVKASNLYAPGVEQRLAHFSYEKTEYWAREIPSFQVKIKHRLNLAEQEDLAYAVGTQLGRGHQRSLKETKPEVLEKHLLSNYKNFLKMARLLNREVLGGFDYFTDSLEWKEKFA